MPDPIDDLIAQLSRAKRVLITTHVRPDGDAIGSTAALSLALSAKSIANEVLLLSPLPEKFAPLYDGVTYQVAEKVVPPERLAGFDALLVVDTGTFSQLPGLDAHLPTWTVPKLVIDHHRTQEPWGEVRWVDNKAAAACEMVERLLARWNVTLTPAIATALFTGLATDTGWFQYSNTTPETFRTAARLVEAGVDADALQQRIYMSEREQRLTLMQRVMPSLRFDAGGRVATMIIRQADYAAVGASNQDTDGLVNLPLQVANVAVAALITEPVEGDVVRISTRGKGGIDLSAFAQQYGGGGHARAAGLKMTGTVDAVREQLVAALTERMNDVG